MVKTGKSGKIIIYSTPTCGWCRVAKKYFNDKKIRYKEIDVTRDRNAAKEMVRISGQRGVPVISINNNIVVGFDKHEVNRLLGISR